MPTESKRRPSTSDKISQSDRVVEHKRPCGSEESLEWAARVIQQAWRSSRLRCAILAWQATTVSVEKLKHLGFERTTKLMQTPRVVQSSDRLMRVLLTTSANDTSDMRSSKVPGRVFVTGFLFAAHSQLLVAGTSHMDAMVKSAAETMTKAFEELSSLLHEVSWYKQHVFVVSFKAFNMALDVWKKADSQQLVSSMERHYLELDRLWQTVQRQTNGDGDEEWRVGIQNQRRDLLKKIRVLGSNKAADSVVQKQHNVRTTYEDPQPSTTPSLGSAQVMPSNKTVKQSLEHLTKAILDPVSQDVDNILVSYNLTASAALENAKIAHELILDPVIRLKIDPTRDKLTESFLEHTKHDTHLVLQKLYAEMCTIIPPSNPMRKVLDTEFDTPWIESQYVKNVLDVPNKLRLVLRVIRSVCAPIRDEMVDKLTEQVDSVDVIQDIFALVRQLQVDVLNYQLDTVVRPWLRKHAVTYEREKMAYTLESQDVELTTAWMQSAATRVHAEQPLLPRGDFAKQVFREALLDLCFSPTAAGAHNVPITLALDQTRIQELQNEIQVLLSTGVLCALVKGTCKMNDTEHLAAAPKILACLQSKDVTMDRVVETVAKVSGKHLIDQLVRKTLAKDSLAYRAMENGLRKLITAQLDKKDYLNPQFKAELTQLSLGVVHTNVCALVGRIDRLSEFNWQVHVQWYAKINRFIFSD
ncbi:hypothetical protein IWW56_002521 [Coemansia sp. RSA 2131]|nr:hypothetical protein IWW56_002521 [Coemansia sp. RSA 2131]